MTLKIDIPNSASYDVNINKLKKLEFDRKVVIVTNLTVSKLHLKYLMQNIKAKDISIITLFDGEEYKNINSLQIILNHCLKQKLDRKSLLISFGGGVIGDMTGFAAAIYQRGIDFMQIPTTLLAQVDASVGGKTGINSEFGKNLIGAFHQPCEVNIDPYFLSTLPPREFVSGVAEIVKMAVTFDKAFFEWLENNMLDNEKAIQEAIAKSIQIKATVVNKDEKEKGIRAVLNYGHTFGHVIEKETGYKSYLHGEAVGIGMVMANKLAVKMSYMSEYDALRVEKLLIKYNIPTNYKIDDVKSFYNDFYLDKKSQDNKIKFVLPRKIGEYIITDEISKDDVISVLEEFTN